MRTSLLAALVGVHAYQGTRYTVAGEVPHGQGNHHPSICPYGLFDCADGMLQIAVGSEALWRRFAAEFDLPLDAPGFARNADRVGNRDAVHAAIDAAFAPHPLAELLPRLAAVGIPSGRGPHPRPGLRLGPDPLAGPGRRGRPPAAGPIELPGPPLRFDGSTPVHHTAPPRLGQHDASRPRVARRGGRALRGARFPRALGNLAHPCRCNGRGAYNSAGVYGAGCMITRGPG